MFSRQRYVVLGILVLAGLAAQPLMHLLQWGCTQMAWDDFPVLTRDVPLTTVLAYAAAAIAAIIVLKHQPTYLLATEVVDELAKVTWPSRQETGNATVVVVVTVLLCSAFLGVFDFFWLTLTNWILGVSAAKPT
jgi:preprotein translocase SecE subunit